MFDTPFKTRKEEHPEMSELMLKLGNLARRGNPKRTGEGSKSTEKENPGDLTRSKSESDFLLTPSEAWRAEH